MNQRTTYELTEDTLKVMKEDMAAVAEERLTLRFASRLVDSKAAAQILGVSVETVRNYVSVGLLKPEPRGERGSMRFRLSYLLSIDINQLKYQRR